MTRKLKPRCIGSMPNVTYFKPRGVALSVLESENLTMDELEALRLTDVQGLEQIEASKKMHISQSTLQRIIKQAHFKVSTALTMGKAIRIEGGAFTMLNTSQPNNNRPGRGRMGGPLAAGPGGVCICTNPECLTEVPHRVGTPCNQNRCPKCQAKMTRK